MSKPPSAEPDTPPTLEEMPTLCDVMRVRQGKYQREADRLTSDVLGIKSNLQRHADWFGWLAGALGGMMADARRLEWCESNAIGIVTRDAEGEETVYEQDAGRADESFREWLDNIIATHVGDPRAVSRPPESDR